MKAVLYSLLIIAPVGSLIAQGTITFCNNLGPTLQAPVYGADPNDPFNLKQGNTGTGVPTGSQTYGGMPLAGSGYTVTINSIVGDDVVEIDRSTFRTAPAAGYWTQKLVTDPFHAPGSSITAIIRAWDNKGGSVTSWQQAQASTGTPSGQSVPFTINELGGSTDYGATFPPPTISGMRSFNISQRGGGFISSQPTGVVVPPGAPANLQVQVTTDGIVPAFQWQRDGVNVPGGTSSTLALTNVQYADAGDYSAVITVSSLTLNSSVARLRVQPTISGITHMYIPEWGADAIRLSYDATPLRAVRIEVRSSLSGDWINMGQHLNTDVRSFFFDIGPTNDVRFYRLSVDP